VSTSISTFLVLGATGRTGRHFVSLALEEGHRVRALVRNPEKAGPPRPQLDLHQGSLPDYDQLDDLVRGVDFVVAMLGDAQGQRSQNINTQFMKRLIPAMRRQGVKRFLYQAGGLTRPYKGRLPFVSWVLKNTLARSNGLIGQHRDNEAVIEYLVEEAPDIEWMVHRAAIISEGPSKGTLTRSKTRPSLATFGDCAAYNYRLVRDASAMHTYDLSHYGP